MQGMRMMVIFEKGAPLRHIGHLDIMRTMQRALRRSTLPIMYSRGFHPHVQLSFASPLSVGTVGLREVMDVPLEEAVEEEVFIALLSRVLPLCLQVRDVRLLEDGFPTLMALVAASRYLLHLDPGKTSQAVIEHVCRFMNLSSYHALRKTKSGEAVCDIRPFVLSAQTASEGDGWNIRCALAATAQGTLRPALWVKCLCDMASVEGAACSIIREDILCRGKDGILIPMGEYCDAQ